MNTFNPLLQKLDNKRCNGRNNNPNQMMFFIFVDIFLLQRAASAARCDVQESKGTGPLKKVSLFWESPVLKREKRSSIILEEPEWHRSFRVLQRYFFWPW